MHIITLPPPLLFHTALTGAPEEQGPSKICGQLGLFWFVQEIFGEEEGSAVCNIIACLVFLPEPKQAALEAIGTKASRDVSKLLHKLEHT